MRDDEFPVVFAGGGLVGLSTAMFLAQHGIPSLAIESAVELARSLRDIDDPSSAFAAYEHLRRARVTRIAQEAARRNRHKAASPIVTALMTAAMRLAARTFLTPERMFGWIHGYRINWDERVTVPTGDAGGDRRRSPAHTKAVA